MNITPLPPEERASFRESHPAAFAHDDDPWVLTTGPGREGVAWMARNPIDWEQETRIIQVIVRHEHRRQGLGTRLLEGLLGEAQRLGLPRVIVAVSFRLPGYGTPPPEVRFCLKHGATVIRQLDTYKGFGSRTLIERLKHASGRIAGKFDWVPVSSLAPGDYETFIRQNVASVFRSSQVRPLPENHPTAHLAIAALVPGSGRIAGLIVPTPSRQIAATLEYQLLAVAPEFRQSALAATLIGRAMEGAVEGQWKYSLYVVLKDEASPMWRFANKHGNFRRSIVNYAFDLPPA